jgi:hypothetical protein
VGYQYCVVGDHKAHCCVNSRKHRNVNVKFINNVADNCWGIVVDAVFCTTSLGIANHQVAIKRKSATTCFVTNSL